MKMSILPFMTSQQIVQALKDKFGGQIVAAFPEDKHPRVHINAENWRAIAEFLYRDPAIKLDWMQCLSGVDYAADGKMAIVADLWSYDHRHTLAVKVYCPRDNPHIPTVCDLWRIADWHEREAYDMFGIVFDNHPDLRRILMADDWVGYPLRKDYVFPREYHGIPASVELDWQQKADYP